MNKTVNYLFLFILGLFFSCNQQGGNKNKGEKEIITWSEHIAPIIYKNCTPCHRPGQSGSFALMNYADAVKKSALIKFVTQSHYMPPWPANLNYSHCIGERVLSADEIKEIKVWSESGNLRGDTTHEAKAPAFFKESCFGKPDLTIRAKEAVELKGNGSDAFLIIKFPYHIDKDTIVDFVEFVPHQRKLVHHVNGHLISYDAKRSFNYMSGQSMHSDTRAQLMAVYQNMHIPYTDALSPRFPTLTPNTVYYLPGYLPPSYPDEVGGYHFKKNGLFLLNNIHYGPSNKDVLDSSYINVFYRKTPIKRPIVETQLGTFGMTSIEPEFIIPPNKIKTFLTRSTLPKDISLLSVNPHMHLIGKSFWAFALKPNGDTIPLIKIDKWDFRWQYYYTYKHPLKIEKGSTIFVYGTYDNRNENPFNPFHPARTITQGNGVESMKTSEEMFQFIFTYVPYRPGDEKIDLERKSL